MASFLDSPQRQRPNPGGSLDPNNPLTNGLVFLAYPGSDNIRDYVSGGLGTLVDVTNTKWVGGTPYGQALTGTSNTAGGAWYPNSAPIRTIAGACTIASWVRLDSAGNYGTMLGIPYASGTFADPYFALAMTQVSTTDEARIFLAFGGTVGNFVYCQSGSGYLRQGSNTYDLLVVTRNGATATFYRNGVLFGSGTNILTTASPSWVNAQPLNIFQRDQASLGEGQAGANILSALWNRDLSAGEVAQLQDNPFGLVTAPHPFIIFMPVTATASSIIQAGAPASDSAGQQSFSLTAQSITQAGARESSSSGAQSVSGAGTLTQLGAGSLAQSGGAQTLTGVSTLTGAGAAATESYGTQSFSLAAQSMTGAGASSLDSNGAQTLSGIGTLANQGSTSHDRAGQQAVSGAGTLTGAGSSEADRSGAQSLSLTSTLTGAGAASLEQSGTQSLSGVGSLANSGAATSDFAGAQQLTTQAGVSLITQSGAAPVDYAGAQQIANPTGSLASSGAPQSEYAGVQSFSLGAQSLSNAGAPASDSAGVQQVTSIAGASIITGAGAAPIENQGAQSLSQSAQSMTGAGAGSDSSYGVQGFSSVITITGTGAPTIEVSGKQVLGLSGTITQAGIESLSAYGQQALSNPTIATLNQSGAVRSDYAGAQVFILVPTSSHPIVGLLYLDSTKTISGKVKMGSDAVVGAVSLDSTKTIAGRVTLE